MRQISFRLLIAVIALTVGVTASVVFTSSVNQSYRQNALSLEAVEVTNDPRELPFSVEPRICAVHNSPMQRGRAPIHYGLDNYVMAYLEAKEQLFPNSKEFILGGCMVGEETEAEVYYCSQCREAEANWRRNNRATTR